MAAANRAPYQTYVDAWHVAKAQADAERAAAAEAARVAAAVVE